MATVATVTITTRPTEVKVVVIGLIATMVLTIDQITKAVWTGQENGEFMLGTPGPSTTLMIVFMFAGLVLVAWLVNPPWAVGLVIGGGISNIVDRATIGEVRDFIPLADMVLFNVADVAVIVGVIAWISTRRKGVRVC